MGLILFEDEHLLAVEKPPGLNTHSPSPFAGEGLYEWLRNRHPDRDRLAILHRLDKETSGVIVFGKTPEANRSLSAQFEGRSVRKTYILLTERPVPFQKRVVRSSLVRLGDRYVSRPEHAGAELAETEFEVLGTGTFQGREVTRVAAHPHTGRTHQIRVHAADLGFPILGDTFYGGSPAPRVCLHAAELCLKHPLTGGPVTFHSEPDFLTDPGFLLRAAMIDAAETDSWRVVHGAADGQPGLYIEKLGDYLLAQSESPLWQPQLDFLVRCMSRFGSRGAYHKLLRRQIQKAGTESASPQPVLGEPAPEEFEIRENGTRFALRFGEGYSVGLFLDQRENRHRLLTNHVTPDFALNAAGADLQGLEALNAFAYTCGFSVCAARAGARVTSLDLSKKYLDWGRRNFEKNGIDPTAHDFIFGDAFEWLRRLGKKKRSFDIILLDPPTFSRSKERGVFQAEKNIGDLAAAALPLLKPGGTLFVSTNAATMQPDKFLEDLTGAIHSAGRRIERQHYVPQPADFPMHRAEPGYLKTVWLRVE
jgi:23S rRNA (cytosine1962-C5)-methyltransferase